MNRRICKIYIKDKFEIRMQSGIYNVEFVIDER